MVEGVIVYPIAIAVAIVVGWRAVARHRPAWQVAARVALVLYLAWMIAATLLPIPLAGHLAPAELDPSQRLLDRYNAPNLVPLRAIRETAALGWGWPAVRLLAGNVLVFAPFGLLLPAIWSRLARPWRMVLAGLCFSGAIELSQSAVSLLLGYWYRMTDVDDVLLNVCGVLLGFAVFVLLRRRFQRPGPSARPESAARAEARRQD